ncbi:MAG TPA: hypothetical protein VF707_10890 [Ardenticatenaceae bacterium]
MARPDGRLAAIGATHLTVNTMGRGFDTPQAHLDALRALAAEMNLPS